MTDLSPLITALEKAEGPSRELDFAIHEFLCPATPSTISDVQPPPGFGRDAISMQMDPRPRYTSSTDAAIALAERLLPGSYYRIEKLPGMDDTACPYWATAGLAGEQESATGRTAAIAIVLAALKAKEAGDA